MSSLNIRDFLHDVLANKVRTKLTIDQFDSLLNMADKIEKFSQKGLLIVTLAEQLQKLSNQNYLGIKKFMHEFITAGVKPKQRKQRQGGQLRRKRRKPVDSINATRDIQRMAEQSLSNPSNLQGMRMGERAQSRQSDSQRVSEQNSKKSGDINKRDLQFAQQLNQISEQMQFATGQDFEPFPNQNSNMEQLSRNSSSSTSSFGSIHNLSQKLNLLGYNEFRDGQKKTKTARRQTTIQATMTKKKARMMVLDQMLTLQKTRATLNQSVNIQESSLMQQRYPWIDEYRNQNSIYQQNFDQYLKIIKEKPLSTLDNITLSARKNTERRPALDNFETDFTQFENLDTNTMMDFTSQPLYSPEFEPANIQMNQLSIFQYQDSEPSIFEISQRIRKPPAIVLYEMLDRMRKGQVVLTQKDVQNFGQIKVQLLSSWRQQNKITQNLILY